MISNKKILFWLILTCSTTNFCKKNYTNKILRSIQNIYRVDSIDYSKSKFNQEICPNNTSIYLIQSPGLKFLFCDLSQTTLTSSALTETTISMTIQNRFGGRFCNSESGQMLLTIFLSLIYDKVKIDWETYMTNNAVNQIASKITTTSSGISALITLPSTSVNKGLDALGELYLMICNFTITNQDIYNAFTYSINICLNDAITTKDYDVKSSDPSISHWMGLCDPKLDMSEPTSHNTKAENGFILGGINLYDSELMNSWQKNHTSKVYIKYLQFLIQKERSFLLFGASADSSVISNIENLAIRFAKIVSPKNIEIFHKPKYGYIISKGLKISVDQLNTTISKGIGGIIILGPINKDTVISAGIILRLIKSGLLNDDNGYIGVTISPFGGMLHLRFSASENNISGNLSSFFERTLTNISTRYLTNENDADFTTYSSIIEDLIKYFSPGSSNNTTSDIEKGLYPIYNDTTEAYVFWMELLYGSFDLVKNLKSISRLNNANKINAIKESVQKVLNSNNISTSQNIEVLFY